MKQEDSPWIRAGINTDSPIWGHRDGIRIGLWPADIEGHGLGGPRGLFRVGYPIKDDGQTPGLVNFIAVEPIVKGQRGFSELEPSSSDGKQGKPFWTGPTKPPQQTLDPGSLERIGEVERLSVTVFVEPFNNGAKPLVELSFYRNRPDEVCFTLNATPDSAPMQSCVLTATMGNYMRLRRLHLADHVVQPKDLWPDYKGTGFTAEAFFPENLIPNNAAGDLLACATTDEPDPHAVPADPRAPGWRYRGSFPLTQYWRKPAGVRKEPLRLRVNGRRVYWAGNVPIPGGLAYENFDLVEPFYPGQVLIFGLSRSTPEELAMQ
jgi:hypothetical protein